jgi:7 transmembrane sweet-taste receptor of 3 GCPR
MICILFWVVAWCGNSKLTVADNFFLSLTFCFLFPPPVLADESWFVTKFTADQDPALVSYIGLQGDANRRKLAETFLRPTTWQEYCTLVSSDHCTTPDYVTQRAPTDETENIRMFVPGLYTGHFRATDANDCDLYPSNCTGHIADYPCGWTSYVEAQTYHLNIALSKGSGDVTAPGYEYQQLLDMWRAANATRSNLMMNWWTPHQLYTEFLGTEAAFQKVLMPPPTQQCINARIQLGDRCSPSLQTRVGDPTGSCSDSVKSLKKLISGALYETIYDSNIPEAIRSPAYDVLKRFQITELQLGDLFKYWQTLPSPREAVCQWVSDNMTYMNNTIPRSYPRVLEYHDQGSLMYISAALGAVAVLIVLYTAAAVYGQRATQRAKICQIEFLFLLLAGSLFISVGAIISCIPQTDALCVASIWLTNIGYTLELIPLVVRLAAISRLIGAGRRMRRVQLKRSALFGAVAVIFTIIVMFLLLWTILDPPRNVVEYVLTDKLSDAGDTMVRYNYYCSSASDGWSFAAIGWKVFTLFCASIVAFQLRFLQEAVGESRTLAVLVYSQFMFVLLRFATLLMPEDFGSRTLAQIRSILFSVDTMMTMAIYFAPKLCPGLVKTEEFGSSRLFGGGRGGSLPELGPPPGDSIPVPQPGLVTE